MGCVCAEGGGLLCQRAHLQEHLSAQRYTNWHMTDINVPTYIMLKGRWGGDDGDDDGGGGIGGWEASHSKQVILYCSWCECK